VAKRAPSRERATTCTLPGWGESRYLRTIDWLVQTGADERAFVLLWIFAGLDGQYGFAFDVGAAYERRFGPSERATLLQSLPRLASVAPLARLIFDQ